MSVLSKSKRLKKELSLLSVYSLATGTTLSAGFFLLPGLAAGYAESAIVLAYLIAALPLIPATLCIIELSTAMPRAGGVYYFLDRSLGPLVGTIGGIGTWLVLVLKVSFALIGMGAYIGLFVSDVPMIPIAVLLAILLGIINLLGSKQSGRIQSLLTFGLLAILLCFIGGGVPKMQAHHFSGFWDMGFTSIISTAGLVFISYVGVTKVASVSEEVKDPERNLPLGILLALGTALLIYGLGTAVMVGVIPMEQLKHDLTPVATAADFILGRIGKVFVSLAALFAFTSVANAGILSASRYPLAMSRDHMMPLFLRHLGKRGTPIYAILTTVGTIVIILLVLDPAKIAKLASTFQLLMFALICLAVIVMRESRIDSYDPGYRSPGYPWLHLIGIGTPFWFILQMGWLSTGFTIALLGIGILWYRYYAQKRIERSGAIYHLFSRLGEQRFEGLDQELRGILKEKGLREEDPFDELVARAAVLDLSTDGTFQEIVKKVSLILGQRLSVSADKLEKKFMEGTLVGATPVEHGAALPHLRLPNLPMAEMVLVRSIHGSYVVGTNASAQPQCPETLTYAFFFLVSPTENPAQHLRILAQIASHVDDDRFMDEWRSAKDERGLKEILLRDKCFLTLKLSSHTPTSPIIGRALRDIQMPKGSLVALIHRKGQMIIPQAEVIFEEGDRLNIIGDVHAIRELHERYD